MQFHEYQTIRNQWARAGKDSPFAEQARKMKPDEFRAFVLKTAHRQLESSRLNARDAEWFRWQAQAADIEQTWVDLDRPYYNFWPVAVPIAQSLTLEVPMKSIECPFHALLLKFPHGYEPDSIGTAILYWNKHERFFTVHGRFANSDQGLYFSFGQYDPDESFESWLQRVLKKDVDLDDWDEKREQSCDIPKALGLMVRLAVFVSLLSRGEDIITPVVLSKDQEKYDETEDSDVRHWLEEKAARRSGRGFDVGKKLQFEKDTSPHWRNPHLALFWTGPGRTKPIIKMRSGALILKVSMAEVPTGFIGPETDIDDELPTNKTPRDSISKSRRFSILKRDGYRCQLCGQSQDGGAILHVDHRKPLAKGGSNTDDNLWTLCNVCNLGKSDSDV